VRRGTGATRHSAPVDNQGPAKEQLGRVAARRVRAAVPTAVTAVLCMAVVIRLVLDAADAQAIALGLPAGLLLTRGLTTTRGQDPGVGQRMSYKSGFWAGVLVSRSRSVIRQGRNR
jgi:hypothetical protein